MNFDLIIFDCDGTLVDSEPIGTRVFTQLINELGWPITPDETVEIFTGRSLPMSIDIIENRIGRKVPDTFLVDNRARRFAEFKVGLEPIPGVREALDNIHAPVCVASSSDHVHIQYVLERTDLARYFGGHVYSALDVASSKPAPDVFLHAARAMGAPPRRSAVIEDSLAGVQAGVAANMATFGYAPHDDGARLAAAGAIVFKDMRHLPELLAVHSALLTR